MNKVLRIILIVLGVIIALFVLLVLINFVLNVFVNNEAKSFVPTGDSGICTDNICKNVNADNSYFNESSSICVCYKQGQIVKQTRITD